MRRIGIGNLAIRGGAALALGTALLLGGCTKAGDSTAAGSGGRANAWTVPHVLTFSEGAGDVNTLNPHFGQFADINYVSEMTMAWLVRWDAHNNPYGELTTGYPTRANGGVSADGLTITYHIRKGVKWSDGAPFDADDVVWSTQAILNPANNESSRLGWDKITKIDEPDKYTVVYHMKTQYSPFVETFFSSAGGNPCILPKHLLARYPNINNVPYNSLPIGIGPFKYTKWDRGSQVEMVANPTYWRGRPKLNKVVLKLIPDRNTMLLQLQAHEIDLWFLVPGRYLPAVQQLHDYAIIRQHSYIWNHYDFNMQRPIDKDPAVRQALRLAINRQELIDKLGHGVGTVQDVTTPLNAPFYVSMPVTPFDLDKANAILDAAGWKRGADGIRAKGDLRLVLDFATVAGSQDVDEQIELVRSNWKKIGVDLNVQHYAASMMFAPIQSGGVVYGNKWDIVILGWTNDAIGDYSPIFGCQSLPPNGQNDLRWCNPRAQAAMDALYGHFDQAQRNADVRIVQEEFVKDVPSIVTSMRDDIYVHNKDLKNWNPNAMTPFDNMMDVDI